MSDKKGSRDISELKARLGLKKGAGAPATSQARSNGGVVPPPGMNLPPPPGVTPAAPPQPVIPNAADDPFGAMNAMAAVQTRQRAPEIVIVNDGKPVENVGSSTTGSKLVRIVLPAIAALAVGLGIGRVSKDASFYNEGLKDARTLLGDPKAPGPSTVIATKKLVADLDQILDGMATKSKLRPDAAADKQLTELAAKLEVNSNVIFRAKENALNDELAAQILTFYAGVAEIKGMLDVHEKNAKGDDQLLSAGKKKAEDAALKDTENGPLAGIPRYGIMISAPSSDPKDKDANAEFGAKLVELGPVFCGTTESKTGKCPDGESVSGFGARGEPGGIFTKADLVSQGTDAVPTKKLVLLLGNGMREAMIKGTEASASEIFYVKRLQELQKRTKKLLEDANKLEGKLSAEANKSNRFSFFL